MFLVTAQLGFLTSCGPGEFECNYAADGCISPSKVYDGIVDCKRDGFDENEEARSLVANKKFPDGEFFSLSGG